MGGKNCVGSEKRWKGKGVCTLQGPQQGKSKDDLPVPHTDILVDNTTGHVLLSFMDVYASYNQVKLQMRIRKRLPLSPLREHTTTL